MTSLVVGTAGHIDHGKSALVKALTGTDPDRLKEEQARGITIDLGFAHMRLGDLEVAFVDVPGHERFVRNMLAGAGGLDAVLLVVAADESVMPQTREHFDICRLLALERGAVVLTKTDLVDEDTVELVSLEIRDLTAGSFLELAPIVPVSAKTGAGLDALRGALAALASGPPRPQRPGVARLPVDRVFSVKGFGTVVTGTLVSGRMREGEELVVLPQGRRVRVRGLQVHGRRSELAEAPRRVAANLGAIEVGELSRGVTLATPETLAVTQRVDVRLGLIPEARPLRHGARVRVHHGTSEVFGRVALAAVRGAEDWHAVPAGARAVELPAGGEAYAQIRLERPAVLTRGDRLVIRAYSPPITIGGATVLDPEPPSGSLRRAERVERFRQIDDGPLATRLLSGAGLRGITSTDLVRRAGLDTADAAQLVERLTGSGRAVVAAARVFDASVVPAMEGAIDRALETFHDAHPLEPGMPREAVRETAAPGAPPELFDAVVRTLAARQAVTGTERLALPSRGTALTPEASRARETIERLVREAALSPPDAATLQAAAGVSAAECEQLVHLLIREQRLVRIAGMLFHAEALAKLRNDVLDLKAAGHGKPPEVDVGTFKQRYGLSRKFAIPLLEWLDRERVTRRMGEKRVVL
jgi:selenocysteine-specific elongation factor